MKKAAKKKEITLNDLAGMIAGVEGRLDNKLDGLEARLSGTFEKGIENLAISTAKGFADVHERIDVLETEWKTDISGLKDDIGFLRYEALNIGDRYVLDSTFDHRVRTIIRSERKAGMKKLS